MESAPPPGIGATDSARCSGMRLPTVEAASNLAMSLADLDVLVQGYAMVNPEEGPPDDRCWVLALQERTQTARVFCPERGFKRLRLMRSRSGECHRGEG